MYKNATACSEAFDYRTNPGKHLKRFVGSPSVKSEEVVPVVFQLIDGLMHIGQSRMVLLLFECCMHRRFPAFGEFLQGAHIEIAIVKKSFQFGHVLHQEPPVLRNRVAAHGCAIGWHKLAQEYQQDFFGLCLTSSRSPDFLDQSTLAVRTLVPRIHQVKLGIGLVNHHHRTFDAAFKMRARHNNRNLDNPVSFRIQPGHFTVQPDEVLVGFTEGGIGIRHEAIVADSLNSAAMTAHFLNLPDSTAVSLAFATGLAATVLLKFWLATRQIKHVAQHRGQVPFAFDGKISLDAHQRAADYTVSKTRFGMLELAWGAAVTLGWTLLGGLSVLNQWTAHAVGTGLWQQVALLLSFVLINGLIDLPFSLYQTFVIEQRFGFNKTTPKLWVLDLIKSSAMGVLIGLPLACLVLWMMGATGNLWWLWTWCVWSSFNLLMLLVYPTWIAPVFNKFQPLEDPALKARVELLMARCGFQSKGFFVMDGSKRSAHANAYFTGFGKSKRVVFYDTLLAQLSPAEVDAVLAHELGHFKMRHIAKRLMSMFAMSFAGFFVLGWLSQQVVFYTGLGVVPNVTGANDALALLLFMMVIPLVGTLLGPLFAQLSRKHEFEADAYAATQTSGVELSSALLKLYEDNASTLTPDPLYVSFYYSHPPATERIGRLTAVGG